MYLPKLLIQLPATGEFLEASALAEGELLGLNEAGHVLRWGVDKGPYTTQQTPEEIGALNLGPREIRRISPVGSKPIDAPPLYPLTAAEKSTVLAALYQYHQDGLGEPFNRSNEVHLLASGEAEDLEEDISLDQGGVQELLDRLRNSDGVESDALLHLRTFAEKQDKEMCDPLGDGRGTNSRPPDGDDWNDLQEEVMAVTAGLKHVTDALVAPAPLDAKSLSDHDLCRILEEMRRRGWAVAAYDVSDVEALIDDAVDPTPTDENIRTWLKGNQEELQDGMCAAMHEAINAEWNRSPED